MHSDGDACDKCVDKHETKKHMVWSGTKCDKCAGPHATTKCPYFLKPRGAHPDAQPRPGGKLLDKHGDGDPLTVRGRVIKRARDGSCLYHSLLHQLLALGVERLGHATSLDQASKKLRRLLASYVENNPDAKIAESSMENWVLWDSGLGVKAYAARMASSDLWGGAIEIAACAFSFKVDVHVWRVKGDAFECNHRFKSLNSTGIMHVLYTDGVHYDVFVPDAAELESALRAGSAVEQMQASA